MKTYRDYGDLKDLAIKDQRFSIVVSLFNQEIVSKLLEGAKECFVSKGVTQDALDIVFVPGAFELPLVAQRLAKRGKYSAIIALGCVIRGETAHFDYVCQAVSSGLMRVMLDHSLPVIFGVLTTENVEQAWARCGEREENKGWEFASCALKMLESLDETKLN